MCVFCLQSIKSRREGGGRYLRERPADSYHHHIFINHFTNSFHSFITQWGCAQINTHLGWLQTTWNFFSMLLVVNDAGIDMPAPHQTHHTKKIWWWAYILHCLEPIEPLTLFVDSHNSKLPRMHLIWFIKKRGFQSHRLCSSGISCIKCLEEPGVSPKTTLFWSFWHGAESEPHFVVTSQSTQLTL